MPSRWSTATCALEARAAEPLVLLGSLHTERVGELSVGCHLPHFDHFAAPRSRLAGRRGRRPEMFHK
jgi:hypothetical protein